MLSYKTSELTQKEMYKLLIGSVIPRPVLMLSTLSENNQLNLAPFSFFSIVSYNPPLLMVSIQRKNGEKKDTARNILNMGEAVGHIVDEQTVQAVNITAAPFKYGESELPASGLTAVESLVVQPPGIKESKIRYELSLYQHIPIKDDDTKMIADLFLLRVEYIHINESVYQDTYVLPEKLNPVSRLAGNDYASLGNIFTIERPK